MNEVVLDSYYLTITKIGSDPSGILAIKIVTQICPIDEKAIESSATFISGDDRGLAEWRMGLLAKPTGFILIGM